MKTAERTYQPVDFSQRSQLITNLMVKENFLADLQIAQSVIGVDNLIKYLPDSVFVANTINSEKTDLESIIRIICDKANDTDYISQLKEIFAVAQEHSISIPDAITRYNKERTSEESKLDNATRLKIFKEQIENNSYVHLFIISGETGSGKTTWCVEQFADAPVVGCTPELTPFDLMYCPDPSDITKITKSDFFKVLCGEHKSNIVILDEGNMLSQPCCSFLQQVTDGVKKNLTFMGETFPINPDFKIIITMNPDSDTDARTLLGDALLSRSYGIMYNLTLKEKSERFGVPEKFIKLLYEVWDLARQTDMVSIRECDARLIREFWNTPSLISSLEFHLTGQKKEDNGLFWNNLMQNDSVIEKITEMKELKGENAVQAGGFKLL